jgi:hypothetical protein
MAIRRYALPIALVVVLVAVLVVALTAGRRPAVFLSNGFATRVVVRPAVVQVGDVTAITVSVTVRGGR